MPQFIATYGYLAVFLLMVAESACIPVPSELIMTFGGALAAGAVAGAHLNLAGVIIAGLAGNVAGSYIAWAVGRYGGLPALRRWGHRVRIREHELERASQWFDRYGPRAVLLGRLLPVVRTFISLPAGIAGMPAIRFGIYTTIGCLPWTAALAGAGYAVGANWQAIANGFHGPTYVIAAVIVVAAAVAIWRYARGRDRQARSGDHRRRPPAGGPPAGGKATPARRDDDRASRPAGAAPETAGSRPSRLPGTPPGAGSGSPPPGWHSAAGTASRDGAERFH